MKDNPEGGGAKGHIRFTDASLDQPTGERWRILGGARGGASSELVKRRDARVRPVKRVAEAETAPADTSGYAPLGIKTAA